MGTPRAAAAGEMEGEETVAAIRATDYFQVSCDCLLLQCTHILDGHSSTHASMIIRWEVGMHFAMDRSLAAA